MLKIKLETSSLMLNYLRWPFKHIKIFMIKQILKKMITIILSQQTKQKCMKLTMQKMNNNFKLKYKICWIKQKLNNKINNQKKNKNNLALKYQIYLSLKKQYPTIILNLKMQIKMLIIFQKN